MTYDDLVSAVAAYTKRTDLAAHVPLFVTLAEADLNRKLRLSFMEVMREYDLVGGIMALPADYLEMRAVRIGIRPLKYFAPYASDRYAQTQPSGPAGTYTFMGANLFTVPEESARITLEYYAALTPLGPSMQTNNLMQKHPDIYLYRVMQEACVFTMDDAGVQKYAAMTQAAIDSAKTADRNAKWSGSALQIRTVGG